MTVLEEELCRQSEVGEEATVVVSHEKDDKIVWYGVGDILVWHLLLLLMSVTLGLLQLCLRLQLRWWF